MRAASAGASRAGRTETQVEPPIQVNGQSTSKETVMGGFSGVALAAVAVFALGCAGPSNPAAEQAAQTAADSWLGLVDQGKYAESWDEASLLFRGAMQKDDWERTMAALRKPMGKNLSRQVVTKRYSTSLPGVPDGEYVVIQFKSAFEKKSTAIETVTPMLDTDGKWRVSGYFIK
jgi:hypothetical protein